MAHSSPSSWGNRGEQEVSTVMMSQVQGETWSVELGAEGKEMDKMLRRFSNSETFSRLFTGSNQTRHLDTLVAAVSTYHLCREEFHMEMSGRTSVCQLNVKYTHTAHSQPSGGTDLYQLPERSAEVGR